MTARPAETQPAIRRIGVVGLAGYDRFEAALEQLRRIVDAHGVELRAEDRLASHMPDADVFRPGEVDLLVTLGGDGTLLRGARLVAPFHTPVLGINLGNLGFLTSINPGDMPVFLQRLFTGEYWLDVRFTLEARVLSNDGNSGDSYVALNDAVLHKGGFARVIRLAMFVGKEEQEVARYSADGVILSTPTGSTAYSLSSAGPIVVPSVDCILATPICPHSLVIRPLVVPASTLITVEAVSATEELMLTVDGQDGESLGAGDHLLVQRGEPTVPLVRFGDQNFFSTLRRKLNWGIEHAERGRT
ncbi:MAG: NAD(+)/NADH kinase [Longimicrobiales bacterium]